MVKPLACALVAMGLGLATLSPEGAASGPDRIEVSYSAPKTAEHRRIAGLLQAHRFLENLREFLSPLRLPERLTVKLDECDGVANAWYEERTVTVCYEYIGDLIRNAPAEATSDGTRPEDAILGPTMEVFLHEVSHAIFDLLKIPILGREEDAADQFAAFLLLQLSRGEVRRAIAGTGYILLREASTYSPDLRRFADTHGSPAQRFYNLICLAYGADPVLFADVVEKDVLPKSRAEECAEEYGQVAHAFRTLIEPHLDHERWKEVQGRRWLRFEEWAKR
jgi:hypothetical protein